MSSVTRKPRKLERYRKKPQGKNPVQQEGRGKAHVREAKALALRESAARKKTSGKLVKPLEGLDLDALRAKLKEAREELFDMRFKHATSQLENVAALSTTRRQIARILTLIKQKEMGA